MKHVAPLSAIVALLTGCTPVITDIQPVGQNVFRYVELTGENLAGAAIYLDQEAVGSLEFSGAPQVCIPLESPAGTPVAAGKTIDFVAKNRWGSSEPFSYAIGNLPGTTPPPSVGAVGIPVRLPDDRVLMMPPVSNVYPGVDGAGIGNEHVGPKVVVGALVAEVVMETENMLRVIVPATIAGGAHTLTVTNHPRYGGLSATSASFMVPPP